MANLKESIKKVFKSKVFIIGILGILIIVGMYRIYVMPTIIQNKEEKGLLQDGEQEKNMTKISASLKLYANDHNGLYPLSLGQMTLKYIEEIPIDPRTNQPYKYNQLNNGEDFNLCTYSNSCKKEVCFSKSGPSFFLRCTLPGR